jgi:hypothetical protein
MKKILFIMSFCCGVSIAAHAQDQKNQAIQHGLLDGRHAVIATIDNATFYDKNNSVIIKFNRGGVITNGNNQTVGYLVNGTEVQDKDHKTLGYFNRDASVSDSQHKLVGYIKYLDDFSFEDINHNKIAYLVGTEPMWVTAYYFLVHF